MEGFLLKELLLSYNGSYLLEVDAKGMIGVKKKNITLIKENGNRSCP
jgi:hypothetical protein